MQNDNNLVQGKQLLNYEVMYKKLVLPHLKPLQMTSSPNLSSLIEALEGEQSIKPKQNVVNGDMSELEKKFNQKLSEYSIAYKSFIEDLMNNTKNKQDVIKYHGKVIRDKDNTYIYVNDYGFTHKYLSNSWNSNDASCPSNYENVDTNVISKLSIGPNMGSGQACKIAGQNVQNTKTNEVAWVDIKGFKHVYPNETWNNKKESCNVNPIKLSEIAYNNIPNDTHMEKNTECLKLNVDNALWNKLQTLNDDLISLSKQIEKQLHNLKTNDIQLNNEIKTKQNELNKYIKSLNKDKTNINSVKNDYKTIQGQEQTTYMFATSFKYKYIIWAILLLFILLIALRTMNDSDSQMISGLLAIVLLFVIYYIIKILY
jgi:hypothetical protein